MARCTCCRKDTDLSFNERGECPDCDKLYKALEKSMNEFWTVLDNIVHLSDWAQQPSVRIKCTQQYGDPAWLGTKAWRDNLPPGVHSLDIDDGPPNGVLYTFEKDKATCPECRK